MFTSKNICSDSLRRLHKLAKAANFPLLLNLKLKKKLKNRSLYLKVNSYVYHLPLAQYNTFDL